MESNGMKLAKELIQGADALRTKMPANEGKEYLLGIICFKFLSDRLLNEVAGLLGDGNMGIEEAQKLYIKNGGTMALQAQLTEQLGYSINPKNTFTALMHRVSDQTFQVTQLQNGFADVEQSGAGFEGLFKYIDLDSPRLGNDPRDRNDVVGAVMSAISKVELVKVSGRVLGDAYETLIGWLAADSGRRTDELYTPQRVAELLARMTVVGQSFPNGLSVYDPAMGSGSLLLEFDRGSSERNTVTYYGQEINPATFNRARMNMIMHRVSPSDYKLRNADALNEEWPSDAENQMDAVVMNLALSRRWAAKKELLVDPRFSRYGELPSRSQSEWAYLLDGYHHLKGNGTMAVILPHGILFRGGKEAKIRQRLVEDGAIDAVIGLPSRLLPSTGIATVVLVLKKGKKDRGTLFIDASKGFEKSRVQRGLRDQDLNKILEAYEKRVDVAKYAHLASMDEIKDNDFNLNIARYVDTFEPEPAVDVPRAAQEIAELDNQIEDTKDQLVGMLKQLSGDEAETVNGFESLINAFQNDKIG